MTEYSVDFRFEPPDGGGDFDLDKFRAWLTQFAQDVSAADVIEIHVDSENLDLRGAMEETISETAPGSCNRKLLLIANIGRCPPKVDPQRPHPTIPIPIPGEPRR